MPLLLLLLLLLLWLLPPPSPAVCDLSILSTPTPSDRTALSSCPVEDLGREASDKGLPFCFSCIR
jgi:hypothetical protein